MNNMNKKIYMLPGDERITASDAKEFVHELRTGSWMDSNCTDEQYMCNFAERFGQDTPKRCNAGYFLYYYTSPFFLSREDGVFLFCLSRLYIILKTPVYVFISTA